jgi:hypothetical protein
MEEEFITTSTFTSEDVKACAIENKEVEMTPHPEVYLG